MPGGVLRWRVKVEGWRVGGLEGNEAEGNGGNRYVGSSGGLENGD